MRDCSQATRSNGNPQAEPDPQQLKTEQRQLFGRVSDEALGDWYNLRTKLRHKGPQ
jgi:hypothetical protein